MNCVLLMVLLEPYIIGFCCRVSNLFSPTEPSVCQDWLRYCVISQTKLLWARACVIYQKLSKLKDISYIQVIIYESNYNLFDAQLSVSYFTNIQNVGHSDQQ